MKRFLQMFAAAFAGGLALIGLIILVLYFGFVRDVPDIENQSYLVQELSGSITEYAADGFPGTGGGGLSHTQVLENLEKAAVDDRIKGVILKIGYPYIGLSMIEEIRLRVEQLQEVGKPVYAYMTSVGNRNLLLATACDSVFQMPTGYVELTGITVEAEFLHNTLEKLGINPNLHKIEAHKSAAEIVQRTDFSKESREEIERILGSRYDFIVETLASDRNLDISDIERLYDQGLMRPPQIVEAGLVDGLLYWDQFEDRLKGDHDELRLTRACEYAKVERSAVGLKGKHSIAVIHGQGTIAGGENGILPILGLKMGANTIGRAFREAMEDEDIDAIVLRLDTGGGEATASDRIGRWVEAASEKKPVVVSISDVAASGGYMIAYRADVIIALPTSIVGSIGSITAKFNMKEMYNKLGITKDYVSIGPNALLYSDYHDWTAEEREDVERDHWAGYYEWVEAIAEHRGMTFEEVKALGGGRVYTGEEALANGLVDGLGGIDEAIRVAKEKAEIPEDKEVKLVHYPEAQGPLDRLMGAEPRDIAAVVMNELLADAGDFVRYCETLDWTVFVEW